VDDGSSDDTAAVAGALGWPVIRLPANRGPAAARNAGAAAARGRVLAFTDADCRPAPEWLARLVEGLDDGRAAAVMGRVRIDPSNRFGQAVAALGFPAGGSTGFEKIWPVDADGFTRSLSTCNCALHRKTFAALGGFDTGFPYPGGEDSLLAHHLVATGGRIRFCPRAVVRHEARDRVDGFLRWQFRRGVSSYLFAAKMPRRGRFVSLRRWSTGNVLRTWAGHRLFPLILALLAASIVVQGAGFLWGRIRKAG